MSGRTIGVDARELLGSSTGVGRYLGELMARWTARPDAELRRFILFTPEPLAVTWPHAVNRVIPGRAGTWWEQTALASAVRSEGVDVFFAPAYTAPLRLPAPLAVTIHDVSFSRHPEWFRPRERYRRQLLTRSAARRAGVVITVSAFSKREIADLYGIDAARIRVIHNGFTPRRMLPDVRREPLVLFAGSIFNRRRVPDLIAAFSRASRGLPHARLVIAGDNRTWPFEDVAAIAASHGIQDRVTLEHYVTDEKLDRLYAQASVFAFLSEYEGFGLTPLEALAAGVPTVVLDTESAREIYGDAVIFVRRGDIEGTADVLARLLTSPDAAPSQLAAARDVLARYSWTTAAEQTLSAIEAVARR